VLQIASNFFEEQLCVFFLHQLINFLHQFISLFCA